ncbi:MAG: amino acid-binding protein [Mailhella sp.]|nr:amino acid-binding protein [Mailhella sp.]
MLLEQLSIFLENRAGRMIEVTRVLAESHINILAMSLADTADFGILRLVVDDSEKAKRVLGEKGFTVGRTSVVAVRVNNEPGGLNRVLEIIQKASINVEYLYAYTQQGTGGQAVIVFRFDRNEQALEALMRGNIPVLSMKGMLA